MNNHEIEQKYQAQKAAMIKKYDANIKSFFKKHGYDTWICFDMLVFNGHCFIKGADKAVIPGGGKINVAELIKDVKVLDDLAAQVE
jgi:hypothetical protein